MSTQNLCKGCMKLAQEQRRPAHRRRSHIRTQSSCQFGNLSIFSLWLNVLFGKYEREIFTPKPISLSSFLSAELGIKSSSNSKVVLLSRKTSSFISSVSLVIHSNMKTIKEVGIKVMVSGLTLYSHVTVPRRLNLTMSISQSIIQINTRMHTISSRSISK